MADLRKFSNASNLVRLKLVHATTGAGLTGLTEASAGLVIATIVDNEAATTRYRASSSEIETIATLGTYAAPTSGKCRFKEVDAANHKGIYEFQFADARFAVASGRRMVISVTGATNLLDTDYEIQLTQLDPYDAVRAGLTSLPNAAAEASGGLPTLSAAQASNGTIQANVHRWLTGTPNALQSGRVDSYLGAVAAGVIAAASFAANALDAVWSTTIRVLTAGTNIVLAKGTGVTGFNDLSAAQVNAEADTALADAGVTTAVTGRIDAAITTRSNHAASDVWGVATRTLTSISALASEIRSAMGLGSANLDTQLTNIHTKTTNLPIDPADQSLIIDATTALAATIAALNNISTAEVLTQVNAALDAAVADSIPALGARPSLRQAAYMNLQFLVKRGVAGTLVTIYQPDGSALFTCNTDSATAPTSIARAS